MALELLTFNNVTPSDWARIQAGLAADGIHISTDAGQQEANGIRIQWGYAAASQQLLVLCLTHLRHHTFGSGPISTTYWLRNAVVTRFLSA
ncbi:MAG: hypothetical protein Q8Q28_14460 [Pseudomonadota bacterium]|nr:hypothetical protein [Pseudomonadota bacterium]